MENDGVFTMISALLGLVIMVIIVSTVLLYKDFIRFLRIKTKYEPEQDLKNNELVKSRKSHNGVAFKAK